MAEDDILAPEVEELCKLIARIIREAIAPEYQDAGGDGQAGHRPDPARPSSQ